MGIYRRLGKRIRAARKRLGFSQPQLASLLGVSQVTISQWERGLIRPSLDKLEPLADKLGAGLEMMLGLADSVREEAASYTTGTVALPLLSRPLSLRRPTKSEQILVTLEEASLANAVFVMPDASMEPEFREGDLVGLRLGATGVPGQLVLAEVEGELLFRRLVGAQQGRILLQPLNPAYPPLAAGRVKILGSYRWLKRRSSEARL